MAAQNPKIHAYLARLGVGSRREIERQISEGRVQIDGKPAKLGQRIDPSSVQIRYAGSILPTSIKASPVVCAVHKPRGIITTMKDPQGRMTVARLVPRSLGRLFPVGRLDLMSEGLLLMTNDGELAERLTHPRYKVPKVYEAKIRGHLDNSKIKFLERGVRTKDDAFGPVEVLQIRDVTKEGLPKAVVTIKIFEGQNHHVRRLFESVKCRVIRLNRIAMGTVQLKGIPRGSFKVLSSKQVQRLRKDVGL